MLEAVRQPWSQGQVEGQINRLKLIKRQMYGRANFDLLRQQRPARQLSAYSKCVPGGAPDGGPAVLADHVHPLAAGKLELAGWGKIERFADPPGAAEEQPTFTQSAEEPQNQPSGRFKTSQWFMMSYSP